MLRFAIFPAFALFLTCNRSPGSTFERLPNGALTFNDSGSRRIIFHDHTTDEQQLISIVHQADKISRSFLVETEAEIWKDRQPTKISHAHSQTSLSRPFYINVGRAFVSEHFTKYDRQYDVRRLDNDWFVGVSFLLPDTYNANDFFQGPLIFYNAGFNQMYLSMRVDSHRVVDFVANDGF